MEKFTAEQRKNLDNAALIELLLKKQEELESMDHTLQFFMEQVADGNRHRFGRSTEKFDGQVSFMEIDGDIVYFNEAEAVMDEEDAAVPAPMRRPERPRGKKAADMSRLPVVKVSEYYLSEEELTASFGDEGYKRLPDEVLKSYHFVPAKIGIEEIHVGVYAGKKSENVVKAKAPAYLLRNSLVSPSIEAAIINGKFVNAVPLYRLEKQLERDGLDITRQEMARWTVLSSERYLSVLYDYLHREMYRYHVLQADETPVLVNKDGRDAGVKSYMWVYRTGQMHEHPIVLYEYQKTRNASHPREFLKDHHGVCITDGYQVYHTIEKERAYSDEIGRQVRFHLITGSGRNWTSIPIFNGH